MMRSIALLLAILVARGAAQDIPVGRSSQDHPAGLRVELMVPRPDPEGVPPSMMVVLHGAGGTATGMVGALAFLAERNFVVVAPKSTGQVWSDGDLPKVREIATDLRDRLGVDHGRLHAAGFSNGGWNVGPVAFDPELNFLSVAYIAAGYSSGRPPPAAKKRMGAIAMCGAEDANRTSAEATPAQLRKHVRRTEVRVQPKLGHKWPDQLMPYYAWWLESLEGRFVPGRDLSFEWLDDPEAATQLMTEKKRGGFIWFYSDDPAAEAHTRWLQDRVFFDPRVRFFGTQLVALKLDRSEHAELFESFKLKKCPAIVVVSSKMKRPKTFKGKINPKNLARALARWCANRQLPKELAR